MQSTPPSTTGSSATSVHSKHPYKEPKQIEAIKDLRALLGPDNEKHDDAVSSSPPSMLLYCCLILDNVSIQQASIHIPSTREKERERERERERE